MRPGRGLITSTRWARNTASNTLCVTKSVVRRSACHQRSRSSLSWPRVISSSAANGSSISSTRGRVTSARAIEARIFMPPDSSDGYARAKSRRPTVSSTLPMRSAAAERATPASRSGSHTLSKTVDHGISVGSWNTNAVSAPPAAPGDASTPPLGRSRPATRRSTVLLPHPDGPTSATNSPLSTASCTPCRACTPLAKRLSTRSSEISGKRGMARQCAASRRPSCPSRP